MFENIMNYFKKITKKQNNDSSSKDKAKERLHLVLMQDRANVSADFLDLMRQEIIDVIKKYIEVDESAIDVRLTNKENEDGTNGAPALYANIPIINIKEDVKKEHAVFENEEKKQQEASKQNDDKNSSEKNTTKKEENKVENEPSKSNDNKADDKDKNKTTENVKDKKNEDKAENVKVQNKAENKEKDKKNKKKK